MAAGREGGEGWEQAAARKNRRGTIDERDNGIQGQVERAADRAAGRRVPPPGTGRLPHAEQAGREELERAEKRHKRLVAWRWLALRFPEAYPAQEDAESNTTALNDWIEQVLRTQSRARETQRQHRGGFAGRGKPPGAKPATKSYPSSPKRPSGKKDDRTRGRKKR